MQSSKAITSTSLLLNLLNLKHTVLENTLPLAGKWLRNVGMLIWFGCDMIIKRSKLATAQIKVICTILLEGACTHVTFVELLLSLTPLN